MWEKGRSGRCSRRTRACCPRRSARTTRRARSSPDSGTNDRSSGGTHNRCPGRIKGVGAGEMCRRRVPNQPLPVGFAGLHRGIVVTPIAGRRTASGDRGEEVTSVDPLSVRHPFVALDDGACGGVVVEPAVAAGAGIAGWERPKTTPHFFTRRLRRLVPRSTI